MDRPETDPEEAEAKERDYREKNKTSKAKVAKEKGYENLYGDLKENGPNTSTSLRKQGKKILRHSEGKILYEDNDIKRRWREYSDKLLKTENRRKDLDRIDRVEGPARLISEVEVKNSWKG